MICKPFWNDSHANLGNLWTILKWFSSESQWFHADMILEQMSLIHKPFWNHSGANFGKSQLFTNHSEMILEWFSVILKLYNFKVKNQCENLCKSLEILMNTHKPYKRKHLSTRIPRFMRMHEDPLVIRIESHACRQH